MGLNWTFKEAPDSNLLRAQFWTTRAKETCVKKGQKVAPLIKSGSPSFIVAIAEAFISS